MKIEVAIAKQLQLNGITNIYPVRIPQQAPYPAGTYCKIYAHTEIGNVTDDGPIQARIQFDLYADSYASVKDLSGAVESTFRDFWGEMGGTGGATVQCLEIVNDMDDYDDVLQKYRVILEIEVFYYE